MEETAKAPKTTAKKASSETSVQTGGFAVIKTGGKQYRVQTGDTIMIEKMKDEVKKGDTITFAEVLLTDDGAATVIGAPFIKGATVSGEILSVGRNAKVTVIKYKQKSRYFKKNGHRQPHLKVKILSI